MLPMMLVINPLMPQALPAFFMNVCGSTSQGQYQICHRIIIYDYQLTHSVQALLGPHDSLTPAVQQPHNSPTPVLPRIAHTTAASNGGGASLPPALLLSPVPFLPFSRSRSGCFLAELCEEASQPVAAWRRCGAQGPMPQRGSMLARPWWLCTWKAAARNGRALGLIWLVASWPCEFIALTLPFPCSTLMSACTLMLLAIEGNGRCTPHRRSSRRRRAQCLPSSRTMLCSLSFGKWDWQQQVHQACWIPQPPPPRCRWWLAAAGQQEGLVSFFPLSRPLVDLATTGRWRLGGLDPLLPSLLMFGRLRPCLVTLGFNPVRE